MKTILVIIVAVSLLAVGTMAFAHGTGGWGSGHMDPGYGGHMMGQGYGGHMMGLGYGKGGETNLKANQEFLDKTVDMRKALHDKKFEYRESARNPETTIETLTKIEKDIFDIRTKIREIAPRSAAYSGSGPCWGR